MDAAPVFTEVRIEALQNHLRALMKALKAGYVEATAAGATQKQREDAADLTPQLLPTGLKNGRERDSRDKTPY